MLQENKVNRRNRTLQLICRVNNTFVEFSKEKTLSMVNSNKLTKDRLVNNLLNWQETEREIGFYSDLAYADLEVPKKFNCIFDYQNPEINVEVKMILTQSIFSSLYPINMIEHVHRHLIILKFDDKIPELISNLCLVQKNMLELPKDYPMLGICQIEDFKFIKNNLVSIKKLKQRHGGKWYNYHF